MFTHSSTKAFLGTLMRVLPVFLLAFLLLAVFQVAIARTAQATTEDLPPAGRLTGPDRPSAATDGDQLTLLPGKARPGADIRFQYLITTFTPGRLYWYLSAPCLASDFIFGGGEDFQNPGVFQVQIAEDAIPSTCTFSLYAKMISPPTDVLLVQANLQVLAPVGLSLDKSSGAPGTVVNFTVSNVEPGSRLSLDYAGVPVFGPVTVPGSSWPLPVLPVSLSNSFKVPGDRPVPLGSATTVQALIQVGKTQTATTTRSFTSQAPSSKYKYAFSSVTVNAPLVAPGQTVTITGQIDPPASSVTRFKVLYQESPTRTIPLHSSVASTGSAGDFSLTTDLPDLRKGDASSLGPGGKLIVLATTDGDEHGEDQGRFAVSIAGPELVHALRIVVQDRNTHQPISDAFVTVIPAPGLIFDHMSIDLFDDTNQLTQWAIEHGIIPDPSSAKLMNDVCNSGANGVTAPTTGDWTWLGGDLFGTSMDKSAWLQSRVAEVRKWVTRNWDTVKYEGHMMPDSSGNRPYAVLADPPADDPSRYFPHVVVVNAMDAGYGQIDQYVGPIPNFELVFFDAQTGIWLDSSGQVLAGNTLLMLLDNYFQGANLSIYPSIHHEPLYSFAGVTGADLSAVTPETVKVWVNVSRLAHDQLIDKVILNPPFGPSIELNHAEINENCRAYDKNSRFDFLGAFNIDLTTTMPGTLNFSVTVFFKQGNSQVYHYTLDILRLPGWFNDPIILNRVGYNTYLTGDRIPPGLSFPLSGNILHYGDVYNETGAQLKVASSLGNFLYSTSNQGGLSQTILDKPDSRDLSIGASPDSTSLAPDRSSEYCPLPNSNDVIPILRPRETIFDTGRIDLASWIICTKIGCARVSTGFSFSADLAYNGYIQTNPPNSCLAMIPDSTFDIPVDAVIHFLFVVADAGASFKSRNTESLTTVFENANPTTHFRWGYRGDIRVWWGLICICDECLFDMDDYEENVYCEPKDDPNLIDCNARVFRTVGDLASAGARKAPASPGNIAIRTPRAVVQIATDDFSQVMGLASGWGDGLLRSLQYDGHSWGMTTTLDTGNYPIDPALAYYDKGEAVALWSETSLEYTPGFTLTHTYTDVITTYHLASALWDGSSWSAHQDRTSATTGDAQGALAGCLADKYMFYCPEYGAVTAVWTHDRFGSPSRRLYSGRYASFDGATQTWSVPAPIDPNEASFTGADTQPQVIYAYHKSGENPYPALAIWIRDVDTSIDTLSDRRIATRWLTNCDGSPCPVEIPSGLPDGIMNFSLARLTPPAKDVLMAFTRAEGGVPAISTHHLLYLARMHCDSLGACSWTYHKVLDPHGRAIYAIDPRLTINRSQTGAADEVSITFRGMGFAPGANGDVHTYPEDAIGMTLGTGDMIQVDGNLISPKVGLHNLTNDGAVNWNIAAIYDKGLQQNLALAIRGANPMLSDAQLERLQPQAERVSASALASEISGPLAFVAVPRQPDFDLISVVPSAQTPQPGEPFSVTITIRNDGLDWQWRLVPLSVTVTWDDPAGLGLVGASLAARDAGGNLLTELDAGETVSFTLPVDLLDLNLDYPHDLYVTLNSQQNIPELTPANGSLSQVVGGLPAPANLSASARIGNPYVSVKWDAVGDPRLVGYRIYRAEDRGVYEPVGSSFVPGFVDVTAELGKNYRYAVSIYTIDGVESPLSAYYPLYTQPLLYRYLPVIRR